MSSRVQSVAHKIITKFKDDDNNGLFHPRVSTASPLFNVQYLQQIIYDNGGVMCARWKTRRESIKHEMASDVSLKIDLYNETAQKFVTSQVQILRGSAAQCG